MSTFKTLKTISLLFIIAMATGCAFTEQSVRIEPNVDVTRTNVGQGRSVSVYVVDERTSTDIGRRGTGVMRGAVIKTENDVATVFSDSIIENMNTMGFEATTFDSSATDQSVPQLLRVDIRAIDYETSMGFWTGGVHVRGAMKATATRGESSYDQLYRVDDEKRVMVVPGADSNAQMINTTTSALLQEMFNDFELFKFLSE